MSFADVDIDQVRAYWNARPCNRNHSFEPIGTKLYFDEVEEQKYLVEPHIPGFADFPRWVGRRVLEIGCGLATDTINFARAGASVIATDLSDVSLDLARRRAQVEGQRVDFRPANAERLDRELGRLRWFRAGYEGPADLVYSFGVIHHSPHPERILAQAHQLLADDGTLKIMVYHRRSWKVAWIIVRYGYGRFWKAAQLVARNSEAQTGCPVTYTYTRRQARQLVEAAGFDVTELRVDHIFPYRIGPYKQHQLTKTWYWRVVPQRLFRRLERRFGWHLMITAKKGKKP